jgi:hypothetical protein
MTPEDVLANELRKELDARVSAWKREREQLQGAQARIAELDQLIAFAEEERETFKVARRSTRPAEETPPAGAKR